MDDYFTSESAMRTYIIVQPAKQESSVDFGTD